MKKLILSLSLITFIVAGCNEKPDPEQDQEVYIDFSVDSQLSSMLKSDATTAEETIDRIVLFGAAGTAASSSVTRLYLGAKPSGSLSLTISRTITTLYAIANPTTSMETATTVSNLTAMTGSFSSMPTSPFLMSGQVSINSQTNKNITVNLDRAVAKVEFSGTGGFVITSVTVQNTPTSGYVFPRSPLSVPTTTGNYAAVTSASPILYVTENTTSTSNPPLTNFRVNGRLNGGAAANYDINLKSGGNNINIMRNTRYQVTITAITEDVCSITVNIPKWNDVITDNYTL